MEGDGCQIHHLGDLGDLGLFPECGDFHQSSCRDFREARLIRGSDESCGNSTRVGFDETLQLLKAVDFAVLRDFQVS